MMLTKFFGCCSLRTGSLIIGAINLALAFAGFVLTTVIIARVQNRIDYFNSVADDQTVINNGIFKSTFVVCLLYIIIMLMIAVLFIVGILKRKSYFILPYISVSFVNCLLAFSSGIGSLSLVCTIPLFGGGVIFLTFVIVIVSLSLECYFWLVVFCFYQKLINEKYGHLSGRSDVIIH